MIPSAITGLTAASTVAGQITLSWSGGLGNNVKYSYALSNGTNPIATIGAITGNGVGTPYSVTLTLTTTNSVTTTVTLTASVLGGSTSAVSNSIATLTVSYTNITPLSTLFTSNTVTLTGQTPSFLNGTYTVSANTYRDAWWQPFYAFNNNGISSTGHAWISSTSYSNSTYLYTGGTTTTVSGTSIGGDWLQLQIPTAKTLSSYNISPDTPASSFLCSVLKWTLAGSNDGSTWSLINSQDFTSNPTYWNGKTSATFTVSTTSYAYYRLIAQASQAGAFTFVCIPNFNITVIT